MTPRNPWVSLIGLGLGAALFAGIYFLSPEENIDAVTTYHTGEYNEVSKMGIAGCDKLNTPTLECQLSKYIGTNTKFSFNKTELLSENIIAVIDDKKIEIFVEKRPKINVYHCQTTNFESLECKVYEYFNLIDGWSLVPTDYYVYPIEININNEKVKVFLPQRENIPETKMNSDGTISAK